MPSRNPSRSVSDGPSYAPDSLPAYRGGGAAVAAFDINSIFTAPRVGDFYEPSGFYQDSAGATAAVLSGDVIQESRGARTVVGPTTAAKNILKQANAAYRPDIVIDATHGAVMRFPASTTKYLLGFSTTALGNAITNNGGLFVSRIKLLANSTSSNVGYGVVSYDRNEKGLYFLDQGGSPTKIVFGRGVSLTNTANADMTTHLGSWATIVAKMDNGASTASIYINDPDTPVATFSLATILSVDRLLAGPGTASFSAEVHEYKRAIIDDPNAATVAQLMSWAEA